MINTLISSPVTVDSDSMVAVLGYVSMYVWLHAYLKTCACIYIYIYIIWGAFSCMYLHMSLICVNLWPQVRVFICIHTCMKMHMCICMYVYNGVIFHIIYIYIYIYMKTWYILEASRNAWKQYSSTYVCVHLCI